MYLDYATRQARRHIPMTMEDWKQSLTHFLDLMMQKYFRIKGKLLQLLRKNLRKVNLRSTELYRIHCMKVTLIN